jgi:hypothetical protein
MTHTIKMFLKFGSLENIQDLFRNGTIYLNTIEYFHNIEDKELRGDKYEGATKVINSLPGTFRIPNVDRDFKYEKIHLKESFEIVLGNLYCLYCISSYGFKNLLDFKLDERNLRFGTHCLMIKDNQYLFSSIEKELKKNGYKYHHGFVEYYDRDKISKELTIFNKPNEFEYQKEFRFYVYNDQVKPIKINIGSLQDKAEIFAIEDMMSLKLQKRKIDF